MITAYGFASVGNEHYVLSPAWDPEGSYVARTLDDALHGMLTWPGNVYELRVDPADVLTQGPHVLQVRRYEVVGVLPRERVFGRNVAALDTYLAELPSFGWLRPSGQDRAPQAAALTAEHYAALGAYGRLRPGPSHIVHELDTLGPFITSPFPVASREGLSARKQAHRAATRAVDRKLRPPLKEALARTLAGVVIPAAWRAAWEHVSAGYLEFGMAAMNAEHGPLDVAGSLIAETLSGALEAAMEPGMEELMHLDPAGVQAAELGRPVIERTIEVAAAAVSMHPWDEDIVPRFVRTVWFQAWRFTTHALSHVTWHAFSLAAGLRQPDPWAPWVGMLRLGLWPASDDGLRMTIYEPRPRNE